MLVLAANPYLQHLELSKSPSNNDIINRFFGNSFAHFTRAFPSLGMAVGSLHIGHGKSYFSSSNDIVLVIYVWRQASQNVCWQGSIRGTLSTLRHIEHCKSSACRLGFVAEDPIMFCCYARGSVDLRTYQYILTGIQNIICNYTAYQSTSYVDILFYRIEQKVYI